MDRIVLYRSEPTAGSGKWWKTDAGTENNGDIRIISGDGKQEWHIVIAADDMKALKAALLRHLPDAPENAADDALALVAEKFTARDGGENPYDAILSFLARENIRHKTTVW